MKFMQLAKIRQDMSDTQEEALKAFETSCSICINRGLHIECERCPLQAYHEMTMAALEESEKEMEYIEKLEETTDKLGEALDESNKVMKEIIKS